MRLNGAVAGFLCAASAMLPLAVQGADLDDRYPPYDRRSERPYDDPRYRDLYADPPPRYAEPRTRDDERRYRPRTHRNDGYLEPLPFPPRFADTPRYSREPQCLSRREVYARLTSGGWSDFHDIEIRDRFAQVKALRPSGQLFDLEIDRCTGGIVAARRLPEREPRPYAWSPPLHGRRY